MKKFICSDQTNQKLMRKGTTEVNDVNQEPAISQEEESGEEFAS